MTGAVAWFTGLPSSGKTTLAHAVAGELRLRDIRAVVLDSDELRTLLPHLGYDEASRNQFYGLLARLAALIARQGHVVLVPATAHRRAWRDAARGLAPAFLEIFVDTPKEECRRRDTKALYADNVAGAPGVTIPYERPTGADFHIRMGDTDAAAEIAERLDEMV